MRFFTEQRGVKTELAKQILAMTRPFNSSPKLHLGFLRRFRSQSFTAERTGFYVATLWNKRRAWPCTGLTGDVINSYGAFIMARRVALFMLGVICARHPPSLGM
jgi:hypothetical protein